MTEEADVPCNNEKGVIASQGRGNPEQKECHCEPKAWQSQWRGCFQGFSQLKVGYTLILCSVTYLSELAHNFMRLIVDKWQIIGYNMDIWHYRGTNYVFEDKGF